jgi:hypothetical protein
MGVDPHAAEGLRRQAAIHLPVEEVGHGLVVEANRYARAILPDKLDVFEIEQVLGCGNAEAAHLGLAQVTQEQELRPGGRAQS